MLMPLSSLPILIPGMVTQMFTQGCILSLPYQEASQISYYNQAKIGAQLYGELDPCLQLQGSVTQEV